MGSAKEYTRELREAPDTVEYLRQRSGMPGPRANLELLWAAAEFGDEATLREWIGLGFPEPGHEQPSDEFLAGCGIVGLGRLVAGGLREAIEELRRYASDARWRVREAVAMALQRIGDEDAGLLFEIASAWAAGRPYEQRAAVAGVAEPRLIKTRAAAQAAIDVVDTVTERFSVSGDRRSDESRTLRQALGYCWSVVVVAYPECGRPRMERWAASTDPDISWVLRENLKKNRLLRLDSHWVNLVKERVGKGAPGFRP